MINIDHQLKKKETTKKKYPNNNRGRPKRSKTTKWIPHEVIDPNEPGGTKIRGEWETKVKGWAPTQKKRKWEKNKGKKVKGGGTPRQKKIEKDELGFASEESVSTKKRRRKAPLKKPRKIASKKPANPGNNITH